MLSGQHVVFTRRNKNWKFLGSNACNDDMAMASPHKHKTAARDNMLGSEINLFIILSRVTYLDGYNDN